MKMSEAIKSWWPFRDHIQSISVGILVDRDLWGWYGEAHKGWLQLIFVFFYIDIGG